MAKYVIEIDLDYDDPEEEVVSLLTELVDKINYRGELPVLYLKDSNGDRTGETTYYPDAEEH